ncbi:MAG: SPOR domain-containing protein [Bacteroidota bacterium]|nr:SPOR domain-containing protein [Candidatus Kapabacteria bacterium]MDW8221036.1 SPOR domain-containing protein [Bacteroidota bacterium]
MIELDDNVCSSFLDDEERGGFDEDKESFLLGIAPSLEAQQHVPDTRRDNVATTHQEPPTTLEYDILQQEEHAAISDSSSTFVDNASSDNEPDNIADALQDSRRLESESIPQHSDLLEQRKTTADEENEEKRIEQIAQFRARDTMLPTDEPLYETSESRTLEHDAHRYGNNFMSYAQSRELDHDTLLEQRYQEQLRIEQEGLEKFLHDTRSAAGVEHHDDQQPSTQQQHNLSTPLESLSLDAPAAEPSERNKSLRRVISIPSGAEERAMYSSIGNRQASHQRPSANTSQGVPAVIVSVAIISVIVAIGYMLLRMVGADTQLHTAWSVIQTQIQAILRDTSIAHLNIQQFLANRTHSMSQLPHSGDTVVPLVISDSFARNSYQALAPSQQQFSSTQTIHANDTTKKVHNSPAPDSRTSDTSSAQHNANEPVARTADRNNANVRHNQLPTIIAAKRSMHQPSHQPTLRLPQYLKQRDFATLQTQQVHGTVSKYPHFPAARGIFAIQVCATPSLAEAEEWLARLKQRGVINPTITSDMLRGQPLYRVRFGLYHSLEEAERYLSWFGYPGSWVVRLR